MVSPIDVTIASKSPERTELDRPSSSTATTNSILSRYGRSSPVIPFGPAPVVGVAHGHEGVAVARGVRLVLEGPEADRLLRVAGGRRGRQRSVVDGRALSALRHVRQAGQPLRREHERARALVEEASRERHPRAAGEQRDILARGLGALDLRVGRRRQRAGEAGVDVELHRGAIERLAVVELDAVTDVQRPLRVVGVVVDGLERAAARVRRPWSW